MKNYTITVNGIAYDVVVEEKIGGASTTSAQDASPVVPVKSVTKEVKAVASTGSKKITAGAAGKVFKVEASVGQTVKSGDAIVILEAMKMEIPIVASCDGIVKSIEVTVGDMVESGATLATMD